MNSYTGVVTMFDIPKGFGFIASEQESFFVHRSNVIPDSNGFQSLHIGDNVQFEIATVSNNRVQAVKVRKIAPAVGSDSNGRN